MDEECTYYNSPIRSCGIENYKTCTKRITTNTFKSSFNGKTYYTKTSEPLSCKSLNVTYSLNCTKWEQFLYVGETGCLLHQPMDAHPNGAINNGKLVYQNFPLHAMGHLPSHIKVQILKKVHKKFGGTKLTN